MVQESNETNISTGSLLCMSCGICCTGHLFVGARINRSEAETVANLGLTVLQLGSENLAFRLPCPLWDGCCSIYTHLQKPSICGDFKCKLLVDVEGGQIDLKDASKTVLQVKEMIRKVEAQFHVGQDDIFYRSMLEQISDMDGSGLSQQEMAIIRMQVGALMVLFTKRFGVTGLFSNPVMEQAAGR